mgnify:CR=1 FL=1
MLLHFTAPAAVARLAFADRWQRAWLIMVTTMVVDLDHLLADPIYDPNRCGIGFHPLHTWPAIAVYLILASLAPTRIVGLGLVIHMALDALDCLWIRLAQSW